jgi:hypothetical protein
MADVEMRGQSQVEFQQNRAHRVSRGTPKGCFTVRYQFVSKNCILWKKSNGSYTSTYASGISSRGTSQVWAVCPRIWIKLRCVQTQKEKHYKLYDSPQDAESPYCFFFFGQEMCADGMQLMLTERVRWLWSGLVARSCHCETYEVAVACYSVGEAGIMPKSLRRTL